jgi:hypothetical protein
MGKGFQNDNSNNKTKKYLNVDSQTCNANLHCVLNALYKYYIVNAMLCYAMYCTVPRPLEQSCVIELTINYFRITLYYHYHGS